MSNPKLYAGNTETIKEHILDLNFVPYKKISNAKGYTLIDVAAFSTCTLMRFTDFMVMETRDGNRTLNVVGISYQRIDSLYTVQNTDDGTINLCCMTGYDYFPEESIKNDKLKWQELDPVKAGFVPADVEEDDSDDEEEESDEYDEEENLRDDIPLDILKNDELRKHANDFMEAEEKDMAEESAEQVIPDDDENVPDEELFDEPEDSDEEEAEVEEMVQQEDAEEKKKVAASEELSEQIDQIAKSMSEKPEMKDWKKNGVSPKKTHLGDDDEKPTQQKWQKKPHYDKRNGKPASGKVNNYNQKNNRYQGNKNNPRRNRNNTTPKSLPNMMDMELMKKLLSEN